MQFHVHVNPLTSYFLPPQIMVETEKTNLFASLNGCQSLFPGVLGVLVPGRSSVGVHVVGQGLVAQKKSWPNIQVDDSGTESAVSQFNMYLLRRQTVLLEVWLPFFRTEPETSGALLHISTFGSLVQKKETMDRQTSCQQYWWKQSWYWPQSLKYKQIHLENFGCIRPSFFAGKMLIQKIYGHFQLE